MSGSNTYTAAIIGCGRIGYSLGLDKRREQPASHTMALNENPRIRLIAGCDVDSLVLNEWHDANRKTLIYKDSANLYARHKPDIICIAVNEEAHLKETIDAIISGPRLIILEKPVALSVGEALRIKSEADGAKVPVLVNHERRFSEDYQLAKRYFSKIGDLISIKAQLSSSMCVYSSGEEASGAYSLIHDGTHLVDAVLYFLEDDTSAFSCVNDTAQNSDSSRGSGLLGKALKANGSDIRFKNTFLHDPLITGLVRDNAGAVRQVCAHYRTEKCPDVTLAFSGRSKYFGFDIEIVGTEGRISIGNGYLDLMHREQSHLYTGFYSLMKDKSVKIPKKTLYFSNMVQNAVDFLDGRCPLKSTLDTGINSLVVLEEIKDMLR